MDARLQRIVDLVHRRDQLVQQRDSLTADLDRSIDSTEAELLTLTVRADDAPADGGRTSFAARVLHLLATSPGLDSGAMAASVYGENNVKNRHRLRAVLDFLRRRGKVRSVGRGTGKWEVIAAH